MEFLKIEMMVILLIGLFFANSSSSPPPKSCAALKCPAKKHCYEYGGVASCANDVPGRDYSGCCDCTYRKKLTCKPDEYCVILDEGWEICQPKPLAGSCASTTCSPSTRCHERKEEGYCNGKKCSVTTATCIIN